VYNAEREKARKGATIPSAWNDAAERWQWRARAEAWDMAELERRRAEEEELYRKGLDRHRDNALKLSQVALNNAVRVLQATDKKLATIDPEDITPAMIPAYLRAAAAVAEAALNGEAQALTVDQLVRALSGESDGV
jgi:DNA repair ATPase RecN